jgi:hypothetical protein
MLKMKWAAGRDPKNGGHQLPSFPRTASARTDFGEKVAEEQAWNWSEMSWTGHLCGFRREMKGSWLCNGAMQTSQVLEKADVKSN